MTNLRKDPFVISVLVLALLVSGVLLVRKYWTSTPPAATVTPVAEESRQVREVRLYFGGRDAMYLAPETRELENCADDQACLAATVQALVDGPEGDLVPILPPRTVVHGVTEQDGMASIDFSRELVAGHPGGSVSELLTVYGLADTLAENFPYIRQVRILVEGQVVETLKGHVDLSRPVVADFRYVSRSRSDNDDQTASAEEITEAASAADRSQLSLPSEEETVGDDQTETTEEYTP
jgi:hypothetical protein